MYNILSLDGGGSWAILQLLTLKERFKDEIPGLKGHEILRRFDMVIANSGGSIVLAALCADFTIDESLNLFYEEETRNSIFSKNSWKELYFPVGLTRKIGLGPKYSTKRKYEAFKKIFEEIDKKSMKDLPEYIGKPSLKLIVSTFDALNNRAKFFKSYAIAGDAEEYVPLTKAIHGSSNAPVQYFDFPAKIKASSDIYYYLWDGALGGFNNPVVAGLIEAYKLGINLSQISLVSIGTGNSLTSKIQKKKYYQVYRKTQEKRFSRWRFSGIRSQLHFFQQTVLNQAKTILFQPPDWANYVAQIMLEMNSDQSPPRFIRLSPIIHYAGDKVSDHPQEDLELLKRLEVLDMDLTSQKDVDLIIECFKSWEGGGIKNQPISFSIGRDNRLEYKKGHKSFVEAMKAWKLLPS